MAGTEKENTSFLPSVFEIQFLYRPILKPPVIGTYKLKSSVEVSLKSARFWGLQSVMMSTDVLVVAVVAECAYLIHILIEKNNSILFKSQTIFIIVGQKVWKEYLLLIEIN